MALSSIANRVTGVVLTGGTPAHPRSLLLLSHATPRPAIATGGCVSLVGDLPALIEAIKSLGPGKAAFLPSFPHFLNSHYHVSHHVPLPVVVVPLKFGLAFPVVYHTLGGFRHLVWDYSGRGIDNASAATSSRALAAASVAASAALACVSL